MRNRPGGIGARLRLDVKSQLYPLALTLVVIVLYAPLLGRIGYFSHEDATPYYRALEYLGELRAGHWLPQTFPSLFRGAGYAFPRFYPPLGNAVAIALTGITGDVVAGVHLSMLLSVVLSALTMYALLDSLTRDRVAALIGSLAYIGVPYRFEDAFIRSALAECWAFAWYPLILLGLVRAHRERSVPAWLPFALAALLLSHPPMAMYFFAALAILLLLWRPRPARRTLIAVAGACLAAAGLGAWFWLPQQYYLPTVWAGVPDAVWAGARFVQENRVPIRTLLTGLPPRNGLNLSAGWVGLAAILLVAHAWLRPSVEPDRRVLQQQARWLLVPWWALALFLVFPGAVLSVLPDQLTYIQFPWRVLGIMAFLAAVSLGCSLAAIGTSWARVTGLVLVLSVIARAGVSPSVIPEWTAQHFEQQLAQGRQFGLTGRSEYLPRTVAGLDGDYYAALRVLLDSISGAPRASPGIHVEALEHHGSASDLAVAAATAGDVVLPTIYYDFYEATLADGARLETRDSLGLLTLSVPSGRSRVHIRERLTTVSWVGLSVSLATLLILVGTPRVRGAGRPK